MTDVPLPLLNAPGRVPQAAGGRLLNCYPETLPATAGKPYAYWRVPGQRPWATSPGVSFRGALLVGNLVYAVIDNTVYTFPAGGGAGTPLSGTVLGTGPVTMARNNAVGPDIAIVAPGNGAYRINPQPTSATPPGTNNAVVTYPNGSGGFIVGSPSAVGYLQGSFHFAYPNAVVFATDPDTSTSPTNINALNFATAQSKPDTLYRPVPYNGQLLLCGANSIEVWGTPVNPTGYLLSYVSTIPRGVVGINAIAGHDDGFGKGIFFVGDDFKVSTLSGYTPTPISTPDLDLLIEREPDKSVITVSVYVSQGHGMVVVQGPAWCWEYDTTLQSWHERKSHLQQYWRGLFPLWAFGVWVCGDKKSGNLAVIDGKLSTEFGVNDVQLLTNSGGPTGGTFTLTFSGQVTAAIPALATSDQVQAALQALPMIGVGNIICTGGPLGTAITMTFAGALAAKPQPLITVNATLTGGSSPAMAISHATTGVAGDPLLITIETGPLPAFPYKIRVNGIELYLTKGVGMATGADPLQTDPDVSISISRDGGQTWSNPRVVKIGRQSLTDGRVRAATWGQAQNQGVRWRFRESAPLPFAFMGADMQVDKLR
jgi:hypothetical protein